MDFLSESFPNNTMHVALYALNDDDLADKRSKLAQHAKNYQSCLAIVNAQMIASLVHLNVAVGRSLILQRDKTWKTKSIGNEIVYNCSPEHSIANAL